MTIQINLWPTIAFVVVVVSWITFVVIFLVRKKPPSGPESRRESTSILGLVLQGISYGIIWSIHRSPFTPMFGGSESLEIGLSLLSMLLAIGSLWFCSASMITLGKQWSLAARLVEGHKLVTQGPYSVVRNPIYTGMFGMLLATGLAVSHWIGLLIGILVFLIGTMIRVRSEEKLLREAFGAEFETYARNVPALIPFLL